MKQEIYQRIKNGEKQIDIANDLNVSRAYISKVVNRARFITWLRNQTDRDDVIGDLANDMSESITNLDDLKEEMSKNFASPEAYVALRKALKEFKVVSKRANIPKKR